jgi:lipopolysaccharide exporter
MGKNDPDTIVKIRTFSYVISPLFMLIAFFRSDFRNTIKEVSFSSIVSIAKKYIRFPKIEFWGYIASTVAFSIPIVIIANYWGHEITGLFSKAFYIVYLLALFIGESVGKVLHKEIADMTNRGYKFDDFLLNIVKILVSISVLPFSILIITGPDLFSIFLGQQWHQSGVFAQIISIWMFSAIISLAVTPIFAILNKQLYYTGFQLTTLLVRIIILLICGKLQVNIFTSIFIFSIVNFGVLMIKSITALKMSGVNLKRDLFPLLKPIFQITPLFIVYFLTNHFFSPSSSMSLVIVSILSLPYIYLFYLQGDNWKYFSAVVFKRKLK